MIAIHAAVYLNEGGDRRQRSDEGKKGELDIDGTLELRRVTIKECS